MGCFNYHFKLVKQLYCLNQILHTSLLYTVLLVLTLKLLNLKYHQVFLKIFQYFLTFQLQIELLMLFTGLCLLLLRFYFIYSLQLHLFYPNVLPQNIRFYSFLFFQTQLITPYFFWSKPQTSSQIFYKVLNSIIYIIWLL